MTERKYPVAERFKSIQGEGLYTGTPMAFIRFVGCSVGKTVCAACDTDFDTTYIDKDGGLFKVQDLIDYVGVYKHVCLTGGEPLDRDLRPLLTAFAAGGTLAHIETSGTRAPYWINYPIPAWLTVSPKPGYLPELISRANEVKVILGGLGDGPGWPDLQDALRWAKEGKIVYVQPRNFYNEIDQVRMTEVALAVIENPTLRLSAQLHKYLQTR